MKNALDKQYNTTNIEMGGKNKDGYIFRGDEDLITPITRAVRIGEEGSPLVATPVFITKSFHDENGVAGPDVEFKEISRMYSTYIPLIDNESPVYMESKIPASYRLNFTIMNKRIESVIEPLAMELLGGLICLVIEQIDEDAAIKLYSDPSRLQMELDLSTITEIIRDMGYILARLIVSEEPITSDYYRDAATRIAQSYFIDSIIDTFMNSRGMHHVIAKSLNTVSCDSVGIRTILEEIFNGVSTNYMFNALVISVDIIAPLLRELALMELQTL